MKNDILRFLKEFPKYGVLPRDTNSSFIVLIAKCANPQSLDLDLLLGAGIKF